MEFYFDSISANIAAGVILLLTVLYLYVTIVVFSYWKRRNIKYIQPSFPFGNFGPTIMQKSSAGVLVQQLYNKTTERFIGIFGVTRPMLMVRDPELLRSVFIKDFQHFVDRGVYIDEVHDPLSGHLFSLNGDKWKNLRTKLSPVFTSGKLKAMFSTLVGCGESLQRYMDKVSKNQEIIEVREIGARFTTDIIASVAFGLDINSIEHPDTDFRKYGRKAFEMNLKNAFRGFTTFIFPKLQRLLKMKSVDDDVEGYIMSIVKQTIKHREKNNIVRKDLLQLLIQLRNTGSISKDDHVWESKITNNESAKSLTFNEMAAQAWVFYIAGFETSSSTMSFCLYELARNPDIQRKVQEEIDEVTQKYNNEITYDSMVEMKYLEACIDETLRMYPIVPILNRECTKEYKIPGTDTMIEKGTAILIPVLGIQRDPKYYPNPEQFQPERFLKENVSDKNFIDMPYMPFGEGPRVCIGVRLGKMQAKIGLFLMLQKSNFFLAKNTLHKLKITTKTPIMAAEGGINLRVTVRG